jgi:hypothetical protein
MPSGQEKVITDTKFPELIPEHMKNTNNSIIRSFIIVPMLASSISMNAFTASIQNAVLAGGQSETVVTLSVEEQALQVEREAKAAKIDAYYGKYDLPLTGYGMTMVLAGEKYGVDPMLIAALAMRESTGGKFACYNNPFGWGSCKIKFQSFEHAIDTVAMNLGGHNEKTARYYKGKNVKQILDTYNPPSVVATYSAEVMGIMKKIDAISV